MRQVDSQAHGQRTLWKVGGERGRGHRTDRRRQIGEQPTQLDSVNVRFVWHFSYEYELLAVLLSAPVSHTVHLSPSLSRFHSLMLSLSVRVCTRHAAYMCIYKLHYIHALLQAASAAMKAAIALCKLMESLKSQRRRWLNRKHFEFWANYMHEVPMHASQIGLELNEKNTKKIPK